MVAVGLEGEVGERAEVGVAERVEVRAEVRVVQVGLEGEAMVVVEEEEEGTEKVVLVRAEEKEGEGAEEGTLGVTEEMAPFGEEDLEED